MDGKTYFERMARYNRWANGHVLDACAGLSAEALNARRAAFFPSIMKTLNHVLVADRLWLSRLVGKAESMALDTILHADFADFKAARTAQDQKIIDYVDGIDPAVLETDLAYQSMTAGACEVQRAVILGHVFNHQTHHRGQLHSMLIEAGAAPLVMDLIYFALEGEK